MGTGPHFVDCNDIHYNGLRAYCFVASALNFFEGQIWGVPSHVGLVCTFRETDYVKGVTCITQKCVPMQNFDLQLLAYSGYSLASRHHHLGLLYRFGYFHLYSLYYWFKEFQM